MIKLVCGHIPRSIFAVFPKTVQTGHIGKKFKSSNYIVFWRVLRDNDQKVHSNAHAHPYPRLLTSRLAHANKKKTPVAPEILLPNRDLRHAPIKHVENSERRPSCELFRAPSTGRWPLCWGILKSWGIPKPIGFNTKSVWFNLDDLGHFRRPTFFVFCFG